MSHSLDDIDTAILTILFENPDEKYSVVSKKINVPQTTVFERVAKLKERGIIYNKSLSLNFSSLAFPIGVLFFIKFSPSVSVEELVQFSENQTNTTSAHIISGEDADVSFVKYFASTTDFFYFCKELEEKKNVLHFQSRFVVAPVETKLLKI